MNALELQNYVKQLGISKDQILREEAEMVFLNDLASDPMSSKIVFYGGTALRLAYNSPRFSKDIDLLCIKPLLFSEFSKFMKKTMARYPQWTLKDIQDKRNTFFALLLIRDDGLKHPFSMKVEIHKPKQAPDLATELKLLKSPVSVVSPLLLVPTLTSLKKLKEDALEDRQKARDVFDLWYIAQSLRIDFIMPPTTYRYGKREFKNELQVFLPRAYYAVLDQLYEHIAQKN